MTEQVSRKFLDKQAERIAQLVPGGCTIIVEGGPGYTAYVTGRWAGRDGLGWHQLAYGRTKGDLSAILDGVEQGIRLAGGGEDA